MSCQPTAEQNESLAQPADRTSKQRPRPVSARPRPVIDPPRELGRVIRTITLLRFISEPELREKITAATNKAEP